jgi:hypothetical protein
MPGMDADHAENGREEIVMRLAWLTTIAATLCVATISIRPATAAPFGFGSDSSRVLYKLSFPLLYRYVHHEILGRAKGEDFVLALNKLYSECVFFGLWRKVRERPNPRMNIRPKGLSKHLQGDPVVLREIAAVGIAARIP